jgi:nucleoid-associated protein YgaU
VITSVAGAAHYLRIPRMSSLVDRITLPFAKGMLGSMALLGVMSAPPVTTPPSVQPLGADTMVELPSDSTSTSTTTTGPPETDHATLHLLPDTPAPAPSLPTPISPTTTTPAAATPPAPTAASVSADADSWEIQHGESFWSIAADHLADINGRPMSEREIASYWRQLVDANRTRLANPHDADLLFTGQVIDLPAIAPG